MFKKKRRNARAPYCIEFDTEEMPGNVVAVSVQLGQIIMRDMNESVRVDLCDHPLYPALERYVLNNPSKRRAT